MKNRSTAVRRSIRLLFLVGVLLAACGCRKQEHQLTQAKEAGKLTVVASFYPMYDFAEKIGGEDVEVVNLVAAGTEPHDWEPSPADLALLEEAEVFVYSGSGMEHWVADVLESLDNQELMTVEASAGLAVEQGEAVHTEEHSDLDPHVWLDPLLACREAEQIKEAFVQADPEHKEAYEQRYKEWEKEFELLDREFAEALIPLEKRDVVVAHEAFGYLCAAYDLHQVGLEGLVPDSEPTPARMEEILEFVRTHRVGTVFFEELSGSRTADTIAEETGAEVAVLNPLEGLTEKQMEAGADYFSVMRENLAALQKALQ